MNKAGWLNGYLYEKRRVLRVDARRSSPQLGTRRLSLPSFQISSTRFIVVVKCCLDPHE
jgi:hypothetical protein